MINANDFLNTCFQTIIPDGPRCYSVKYINKKLEYTDEIIDGKDYKVPPSDTLKKFNTGLDFTKYSDWSI